MKRVEFTIPVRTVSEANQREHWAAKHRRKKAQQEETVVALYFAGIARAQESRSLGCYRVGLTRHGPKMLDTDNLAGSFKHVQDSIARWLGVDDGDTERIKFTYAQVANGKRDYSVKVEIKSVERGMSESG